jgi:hypothetical protein
MSDRPPVHVARRAPHELTQPVFSDAGLLATMKGYRALRGMPQLATDFDGNLQDGYCAKLELNIRRAVNESFWKWLAGLAVGICVVDAMVPPHECPVCRREMKPP